MHDALFVSHNMLGGSVGFVPGMNSHASTLKQGIQEVYGWEQPLKDAQATLYTCWNVIIIFASSRGKKRKGMLQQQTGTWQV